jgi:NAD(P)-dependent dehydrogenase (short-subunit alcohol dehydrogenase family)
MSFGPLDLSGRVAVVIGGTSGIGRVLVVDGGFLASGVNQ